MLSALKTKRARVGLGVLVLLAFTGAAVAYFTSTGSGTGTASVANSSTPMTISATITPGTGGLVPGGNPASVSLSVNNPSTGNQYVNQVTLTGLTAYTDSTKSAVATGCNTTLPGGWFSMAPVSVGQDVAPGGSASATGSLLFNDVNSSQDACKGAYLVATFSSN